MGSFEFVYTENGEQQRFSFESRDLSIGRSPDCDFVLDHPTVSRQHARLVERGGGEYLLIVQSEKGLTAVDGEKVSGEVPLRNGAQVYFGKLSFQFQAQGAAGGRQASPTGGQQQRQQQQQRGSPPSGAPGGGQSNQQQQQGQQPAGEHGGGQWDSYEEQVADDPVGGAAGDDQGQQGLSPGGEAEPTDSGKTEEEQLRETVGIESWDDIAKSAEEDEANPDLPGNQSDDEDEQTSPLLILAAVAALGFVGWTFISRTQFVAPDKENSVLNKDIPPVQLRVDCLAPQKCMRKAMQAYEVGVEMLNKPGAEITNLFNGYKKLLEAEALVEKAGKESLPPEMSRLEKKKKKAREQLDQTFQNFRVKYHSAKKEGNTRSMVEALRTIQRYFPDETAREHRWARERILELKKQNRYPMGM